MKLTGVRSCSPDDSSASSRFYAVPLIRIGGPGAHVVEIGAGEMREE